MRHGKAGFKLGRVTAHRWALFRNLLVALFRHERIMTTEAKAKAVRGLADQMVTLAKRDSPHARRQVLSMVPDTEVVKSRHHRGAFRRPPWRLHADHAGGHAPATAPHGRPRAGGRA
jgi:ribosomal protein L17